MKLLDYNRHYCPDAELAEELLSKFGSPLYVYDANQIKTSIEHIQSSFSYEKKNFAFASVTNGNLNLLKIFKRAGWGLHANTPGDAYLGISAGFRGNEIIYSGSNLSDDEFKLMLDWGVSTFNLDSIDQLRSLILAMENPGDLRLGFRLNMPGITGESRTGISPTELKETEQIARAAGLRVTGIHFYRGTSTNSTDKFTDAFASVVDAAASLDELEYLDFGGGFGFPYHDRKHSFDWKIFADELSSVLKDKGLNPELIIEPGRSVIAGAACLLCTVISSKWQGDKQILGADTSTSNIAVLSVHGGSRQLHSFKTGGSERFTTDLCGNTTYSRDYLARNCSLPRLAAGDHLAVLDAGAYGYSMASHFLHRPRAAEVLVEDGKYRLIRKREDWNCLLANQMGDENLP